MPPRLMICLKESLQDGIKDDDFDVEAELKKPAISKLGDLWQLGNHRLYCGDSTKKELMTCSWQVKWPTW